MSTDPHRGSSLAGRASTLVTFAKKFLALVNQQEDTRIFFLGLVSAGCDPQGLIWFIFQCCSEDRIFGKRKKDLARFTSQMRAMVRHSRKLIASAEQLRGTGENFGREKFAIFGLGTVAETLGMLGLASATLLPSLEACAASLSLLEKDASTLEDLQRAVVEHFGLRELTHAHHLAMLYFYCCEATHSKKQIQYRPLAQLLTLGYYAVGKTTKVVTEKALERAILRFNDPLQMLDWMKVYVDNCPATMMRREPLER